MARLIDLADIPDKDKFESEGFAQVATYIQSVLSKMQNMLTVD